MAKDCALGARIKQLARRADLTLVQVADRGGIARSHIHRVLRGECEPSYKMLLALARGLDVEPADLLVDGRSRHNINEIDQLVAVCNRLTYDQIFRVLHYARYEESLE